MKPESAKNAIACVAAVAIFAAAALAACSDSVERAERVPRGVPEPGDLADAMPVLAATADAAPSASEPTASGPPPAAALAPGCLTGRGWNGPGPYVMVQDDLTWRPRGDGRMTVRLSRFPFAGGCGNVGAPGSFHSPPGGLLVWEKTWPDDFRAAAARLGWPEGIFERCDGPTLELTLNECSALAHEIFYGTPEAAEEARLLSRERVVLAAFSTWTPEQLSACKSALAEARSLAVSPQICNFRPGTGRPPQGAQPFPALVSGAGGVPNSACAGPIRHLIEPCAASDAERERAR